MKKQAMRSPIRHLAVLGVFLGLFTGVASADDRLGAHFGAVFPLLTHAGGETTSIGDDYKMGFPMGITVKKNGKWAFDLELVPVINPNDGSTATPLLVHPGVLRSLSDGFTLGVRMGFEINGNAWGFTPLLNKSLGNGGSASPFVEAVMPVRFQEPATGNKQTAVGFGVHVGLGF